MDAVIFPAVRQPEPSPRLPRTLAIQVALLIAGALVAFIDYAIHATVARELAAHGISLSFFDRLLEYIFFLVPFLTAFALLTWRKNRFTVASGAGLAFGLFGVVLLASIGLGLTVFLWAGLSGSRLVAYALLAVVLLFVVSAFIVVCALFQIKLSASAFLTAGAVTVVYTFFGYHALLSRETRIQEKQQRAIETQNSASAQTSFDAHRALTLLTACVIEYRHSQAATSFPASLNAIPGNFKLPNGVACDSNLAKPGAIPNYTFTYTPQQDSSGARFTDFRLLAMPLKKGLLRVDPMLADRRGRIFTYVGWSVTDKNRDFSPPLAETNDLDTSKLFSLRAQIRAFMQNNGGKPPAAVSDLNPLPGDPTADPETLREGSYELRYFSPASADPTRYSTSALCQSYGEVCIRSFFLDKDGEIHQTVEPREATAHDPLIPDCQKFVQTCRDIEWRMP